MAYREVQSGQASEQKTPPVQVDQDGLYLPDNSDSILDIQFDERRIWSTASWRGVSSEEGGRLIEWPNALRPYLDGCARVTVREHLSGEVCADTELAFGSRQERVHIADAAGRPLSVSKWGGLEHQFDSGDPRVAEVLLERAAQMLETLTSTCGVPAFITYGTLLGAVREGGLIGHDGDVDVAYLSAYDHPLDVARESFRIERALRHQGWRIRRASAAFVQAFVEVPDGATRNLDVFTSFFVGSHFYQAFHVRAALPRSALLPLTEVPLHDRRFPAPADPEALLDATYGSGWRVPDPSFRFDTPREAHRRFGGWVGSYKMHRHYWENFYRSRRSASVPDEPSPFAHWVCEHESPDSLLVDIGSGTGRDALWFARSGYTVLGVDYAESAVNLARSAAEAEALPASFELLNLYDLRQVLTTAARLAPSANPRILYGRFLVHALEDQGRYNLWRFMETALHTGGSLYLEFRTGKDAERPHAFGEHFRRLLNPDIIVDEIEARGGHVAFREEGHGLAVYEEEDPHVCRLVVRWRR